MWSGWVPLAASSSDEDKEEDESSELSESKTEERILAAPEAILRVVGKMTLVSQLGLFGCGCGGGGGRSYGVVGLLRLFVTIFPPDRVSVTRAEPEKDAMNCGGGTREKFFVIKVPF